MAGVNYNDRDTVLMRGLGLVQRGPHRATQEAASARISRNSDAFHMKLDTT